MFSKYTITISKQGVSYDSEALGSNEIEMENRLSVFPTPFENELKIQSNFQQSHSLIIKDISGKNCP